MSGIGTILALAQAQAQRQAAPASLDQPWNPAQLGIPANQNDPWGNFNKVARDWTIPVHADQQVQATMGTYDPSSDGWTAPRPGEMSTNSGSGQALNDLIAWRGTAYAQALFEDPTFRQRWEQQYPGTINGLYQGLARRNSNWADNDGPLKTAAPALMTALTAGLLPAGGELADSIPASAAGVGAEGAGTLTASAAPAAASTASDATLQQILDASRTPTISQGVNVADLGSTPVQMPQAMPAAVPEIDPTFGNALTQTGAGQFENLSQFAPAAAGGAAGAGIGNVLTNAATTAAGSAAVKAATGSEENYPGQTTGENGGPTGLPLPGGVDLAKLLTNPALLGAGIGGLLGGTSGSKPAGTTTTVQDIPDWLKPYVTSNLNMAAGARDKLLAGSNVTDAATPEYLKTVNGAYLDPSTNPWLDATYKHAAGLVGAGVDSRFESAGRYGSGAHQGVLQEGFNNLATSLFGGNYQAERARQSAAITGAPAFDTSAASAKLAPYTDYASLFPNTRSTTTPYFTNPGAGILGGALAGGSIGKIINGAI